MEHVHEVDREKVKRDIEQIDKLTNFEYGHWFIKPGGQLIYLVHHVHVQRNYNGEIVLVNGTTKDVTQNKKARIELKKSKQKLQNILESIQDSFFVVDKNWKITYWNRKAEQVFGRKAGCVIGKNIWDEFNVGKSLTIYKECHRAMKEQVAVRFEDFSPKLNLWFEANAYPSSEGLAVYFKDITERKQQEEELRISNERYRFVTMATTDIVWDWDLVKDEIYINDSFEKIFGTCPDPKQVFNNWAQQIHPGDRDRVLASVQKAVHDLNANRWKKHYRIIRQDGSVAHIAALAVFVRNEKREAIRMVGSLRDTTASKMREEVEKQWQQRYKLLFDDSPIPKWIFDHETLKFIEVNDAAIKHYGYSREEFLNMTILGIRPESEHDKILKMFKPGHKCPDFMFHDLMKHRKKNGEVIAVEATSHALKFGNKIQVVVVANDVTEKIEAQKKISRAIISTQEKERSVIGKELHDNVNQLLTTAKLYIQNASCYPEQKQFFLDKGVDIIQKSITEIRSLSKALITPTLSDLEFKDALDELISHYHELHIFKIQLTHSIKEESLDKDLKLGIYRILQELFNNTIKYAKAKNVSLSLYETGRYLRMVYSDDGIGFDKKQIKKGLGINNIRERVNIFKGKFRLHAAPGEGTSCLIVFPFTGKNSQC